MFNLQGSEIIIVLLLALVVLGPEKLPDAMRKAGKAYSELKKMSTSFQSEFRAAVDEPLREIRETANVLRDSADFTKLQDGERSEKPKSGEMAAIGDEGGPTADVPTFETSASTDSSGPSMTDDSEPAPFASAEAEPPVRSGHAAVTAPAPFSSMSSAAPRPEDATPEDAAAAQTEATKPGGPFTGVSSAAPRPPTVETEPETPAEPGPTADGHAADLPPSPDEPIEADSADMVASSGDSSEQGDR